MKTLTRVYFLLLLIPVMPFSILCAQDSSRLLKKVTVKGVKQRNSFTSLIPTQTLSREVLQQINAPSAGDAAKFFSGIQVKDYGGTGGLKTISVRSLGASQTGILYDGINISDAQTGLVDLGRYSGNFISSIDLFQANSSAHLLPARAYSSASLLSIHTTSWNNSQANMWKAGVSNGSFGYHQGFAAGTLNLPKDFTVSANTEVISSEGDYPFTTENGNIREKSRRTNGAILAFQGEVTATKSFTDSSLLQVKGWTYHSKRGLPGAIVFFNNRSVQQLIDKDYFLQARFRKSLDELTSLVLLAKFNHTFTRYTDPDFLNNAGGLDDRYRQNETYFSGAINRRVGRFFSTDFASDLALANLHSNKQRFSQPSRISTWNNLALNYNDSLWQWNASALWSRFEDEVSSGSSADVRNKVTPTLALSRKLTIESPFMIRAFYKEVYRMPAFNDLYYNFIGNTNLRPEYARQYNLGLSYTKPLQSWITQLQISADAYQNTIKDKIVSVPGQNLFSWTMLNLGRVAIKGLDIAAEARGSLHENIHWFFRLAYTYQQAKDITDKTAPNYGDRIPYTPDHSGSAILSANYKKWNAGYSMIFSGTRFTLGENNPYNQLEGWGVQDLFLSKNISLTGLHCTLKGELNNIANLHYDVIRYYPMPGRSYKISILFGNL